MTNYLLQHGMTAIRDVLGDFGVVFWDARTRHLHAMRDALGVRSLYYRCRPSDIAVSSHASDLATGDRYDVAFLGEFIMTGRSPDDRTIFADVSSVAPGCRLEWTRDGLCVHRYWDASAFEPEGASRVPTVLEDFRGRFFDAVATRATGGRVAVLLSGGVDSSAVLSSACVMMAEGRIPEQPVASFTYIDNLGSADETQFANAVASRYDIPNHQLRDWWPWQDAGVAPYLPDQPAPFYPFFNREQRTLEALEAFGADVVMTGNGSDPYLCGNAYFLADFLARGRMVTMVRTAARLASQLRTSFWRVLAEYAFRPNLPWFVRRRLTERHAVPVWLRPSFAREQDLLGRCAAVRQENGRWGAKFAGSILDNLGELPGEVYRGQLGQRFDFRYPFLYRPLIELGLSIFPEDRYRPYSRKWVLREAMRDVLPDVVRERTGHGGPGARIRWAFAHESSRIRELLSQSVLADLGCIEPRAVEAEARRIANGRRRSFTKLFHALSLETWFAVRSGRWHSRPVADEQIPQLVHSI